MFHCAILSLNVSFLAPSRRGDLEILGYCMVQWLCGELPWENKLQDKDYVREQKIKYVEI